MGFALFFLGEYAAMIAGSGVIVTLFLGGWSLPFIPDESSTSFFDLALDFLMAREPDLGLGEHRRLLRQSFRHAFRFHLGAVDTSALSLRPTDEAGLVLLLRTCPGKYLYHGLSARVREDLTAPSTASASVSPKGPALLESFIR